jgi:DnaJ-class molecular chaperone
MAYNSWYKMQANAQEKFLRIKHAYNTLMNSESRSKYASSSSSSPDSSWAPGSSKSADSEEQFYGFGTNISSLHHSEKISPLSCSNKLYYGAVNFVLVGEMDV